VDALLHIVQLRRKLALERELHPGDLTRLGRSFAIQIAFVVRKFKRMMRERGCIKVSSMKL
jgi:hypothetical protein